MTIKEFRNGIFALNTRRFGKVTEILIKKLFGYSFSNVLNYDLYDDEHHLRIEVKFSTVLKNNMVKINEENVIDQCAKANITNRFMSFNDKDRFPYDCNIQQVKCDEFDILYYGLFFADKIEIFKVPSEQVKECPGHSNKQHLHNEGEGQFHINKKTYKYHKDNNFLREMTYQELLDVLR